MNFALRRTPLAVHAPEAPDAGAGVRPQLVRPFFRWDRVRRGMGMVSATQVAYAIQVWVGTHATISWVLLGFSLPGLLAALLLRSPGEVALRRLTGVYLWGGVITGVLMAWRFPDLVLAMEAWSTMMILPTALWLGGRSALRLATLVAVAFGALALRPQMLSSADPPWLILSLRFAAATMVPMVMAWISERAVGVIESALSSANQSLATVARAERMAGLGAMVAGVTHEVNNPLTYVTANLAVLKDILDAPSPTEEQRRMAREQLADAMEGAQRLTTLVRQLKGFARGDQDTPQPMALNEAVDAALRFVRPQLVDVAVVENQVQLTCLVPSGQVVMHVVMNLLANAGQALAGRENRAGRVRLVALPGGAGRVVLEVHDNGPGVPDALGERVFEPFFTTRMAAGGLGLGLSICRDSVRHLGGDIRVERSATLGGACFRVELPALENTHATVVATTVLQPPRPAHRACDVLIVDDEPRVIHALARMLPGCTVVGAASGEDALALLRTRSFGFILSDVNMPGMGGRGLLAALRNEQPHNAAQLVFMTGDGTQRQGLDGARVLAKPLTREVLEHVMAERLSAPPPR